MNAQRSRNIQRRCFIVQRRRKKSPSTSLYTPTGSAFDVLADRHGSCLWGQSHSRLRRFFLSDLSFLTLLEVSQKIQSRALSPVEVTNAELDRIAALDPKLKSYAIVMADSAMAQAKQAEVEIGRGEVKGPLHGVPIAVKDLCWTTNAPTAAWHDDPQGLHAVGRRDRREAAFRRRRHYPRQAPINRKRLRRSSSQHYAAAQSLECGCVAGRFV